MISIVIAVFVATVVVVPVPHFVAVPVGLVAIAVSISIPSHLPAAIPPSVISVVVVSAAVVSVVVVPDYAITKARVLAETRLVLASPFPIFPLALSAQTVVLDIVISTFSKPLPVVRIVVSVVAAGAVIRIVSSISVLCASGRHDSPQSQT